MFPCTIVTLFTITCFLASCRGGDLRTYHMDELCDDRISMIQDDVYMARLKYSHSDSGGSIQCNMPLMSHFDKIAFRFTSFNFKDCISHVSIRIGDSYEEGREVPGLNDTLCGQNSPPLGHIYTTDWTEIHIRVAGLTMHNNNFSMIFNAFDDGRLCYKFEQHCENGRCIDKDLRCNGFNPCGDESDCINSSLKPPQIAGIVVGVVCGFGFVMFLMYGVPKIVEWKVKQRRNTETTHTVVNNRRATNGTTETSRRDRSQYDSLSRATAPPRPRSDSLTIAADGLDIADMDPNDLGFGSSPPNYSMIDYVSVPGRAIHVPEPSSLPDNRALDESAGVDGAYGGKPNLREYPPVPDHGGATWRGSGEYIPPPPPYELVVEYGREYNVTDTSV